MSRSYTVGELKKLLESLPDDTMIFEQHTIATDWGPSPRYEYSKGLVLIECGMRSYMLQGRTYYTRDEKDAEFKALILP